MSEKMHCPHCDAATRAQPNGLHIEAGVSLHSLPFLHIAWRKERQQLSPDEARFLAAQLLESAQVAEYEAAFSRWAQAKLGMNLNQASILLMELREYFVLAEEQTHGRSQPP